MQTQVNPSRTSNYMFVIGGDRDDVVSYSCPSGVIAGIDLGVTIRGWSDHDIPMPSDKITYDDIIIPLYLSDDLREWSYIAKWMFYCKKYSSVLENDVVSKKHKDCTMFILDGQGNITAKIIYHDCFPYNIDTVNYSVNTTENDPVTFNVGFKFTHMTIELGNGEVFNEFTD